MKLSHTVLALSLLPMTALAQNSEYSLTNEYSLSASEQIQGYIGLNLNYSRASLNDELGDALSYLTGYNVDSEDMINPNHFGFSLNVGAQFNRYFGIEAFLQNTLDSTAKLDFVDERVTWKTKNSFFAFGADAIGYIPIINRQFSFIGSFGIGYYSFTQKFTETDYYYGESLSDSDTEKNLALRFGIGGQYAFSERWAMRGIIRYVALDYDNDEDIVENMIDLSMGVKCTF